MKPPAGFTHTASELSRQRSDQPAPKKSPSGVSTDGVVSPSQYIRSTALRQNPGKAVIQICWIAPGPWISATVNVWCGSIRTEGDTFQPRPRSFAATAPVPSVAMPPAPLAPVKFSALIERDFARDRRARLPMPSPRPLNGCVIWLLLPVPKHH